MEQSEDRGLVSRVGPVEIDWPRAVGYYSGIGLAVAFGVVEAPLGAFIALVPFLKMLNRPNSAWPTRLVAQTLDGASKPVGGDSASSIRLTDTDARPGVPHGPGVLGRVGRGMSGIWADARAVSRGQPLS